MNEKLEKALIKGVSGKISFTKISNRKISAIGLRIRNFNSITTGVVMVEMEGDIVCCIEIPLVLLNRVLNRSFAGLMYKEILLLGKELGHALACTVLVVHQHSISPPQALEPISDFYYC